MRQILLFLLLTTPLIACKSPAAAPADSANLARAKQLVEATAADFEQIAGQLDTADPAQKRAAGERLRRALDSRRQEGENLQKILTEDEKQKLREFGQSRLRPAVLAVEKKLGAEPQAVAPSLPASPATH